MASKLVSHYLHPDYLDPLPSTAVDSKLSPLALLAQTCSNIGKDIFTSQPIKDHKSANKCDRQSPISTTTLAKSTTSSPLVSPMGNKNQRFSPHENDKQPSSTCCYGQRNSPCSTKSIECFTSSRSGIDMPNRYSPVEETQNDVVCSKADVCLNSIDKAIRLSSAQNSPSFEATSKIEHTDLQLKSGTFLPDLASNSLTLTSESNTSAAVVAAAAAFGLPSRIVAAYNSYSAAASAAAVGLPWPAVFMPPTGHFTGCFETQCNQQQSCTTNHRPGSATICSCTHCSLHTKSMTDFYQKLLQNTGALHMLSPPQGKVNAEFCMYCGKHCPSLEELINHVRSHDSTSSTTETTLQPPLTFGFYPPNCSMSADFLHKAWSYASLASRFHPYRGTASKRLNSMFPATFGTSFV